MSDLRQRWADITQLLLLTLDEVRPVLSPETVALASEYLEHNELELALRAIQSGSEEGGVALPPDALANLKRAAYLMKTEL